jgi:chaperonin cofactor prefoldin
VKRTFESMDVSDGERQYGFCELNVKYASRVAMISALILSIVAVIILKRDEGILPGNNDEIRAIRKNLTPCLTNGTYPIFLKRIKQLTSKIEGIKSNLSETIASMRSSLENNITDVDETFGKRLTILQNQVSDLKTNTHKLQANFGKFRDATNNEFEDIWQKFDEIESEIARKRGG